MIFKKNVEKKKFIGTGFSLILFFLSSCIFNEKDFEKQRDMKKTRQVDVPIWDDRKFDPKYEKIYKKAHEKNKESAPKIIIEKGEIKASDGGESNSGSVKNDLVPD